MQIKACVLDFDGTITTEHIIDVLCSLVGKGEESKKLDTLFNEGKLIGLSGLIQRINFLKGLPIEKIHEAVAENMYLQKGALEFFQFLKNNNIVSVIASGAPMSILEVYKEKLGADYLIGSKPLIENNKIVSISEEDYIGGVDFKVHALKIILDKLNISTDCLIAIGDSPADKGIFELSAKSIAINPKGDIAKYADYIIEDDLSKARPILKNLMN